MHRRDGTFVAVLAAALLMAGCDNAAALFTNSAEFSGNAAQLTEKGYAVREGRIIRVAEPGGPLISSNQEFLPGDFMLQGYDETMNPEFTDQVRVREGDTPRKLFDTAMISHLQERMKLAHGPRSYEESDYPCSVQSVRHNSDGSFTSKGECRIRSRNIRQSFTYSGQTHEDGFTIDVVRVTKGNSPEAGEKRIRILAHIVTKTDSDS
jgi:hypothetical protein